MYSRKVFCLAGEAFFLVRKPKRVAVWVQSLASKLFRLAVMANRLVRNAVYIVGKAFRVASDSNKLAAIA